MGFRFRKSLGILPGLRLNLTKNGPSSISLGGRGLTLNLGRKGARTTVSAPGTGISYTGYQPYDGANREQEPERTEQGRSLNLWPVVFFVAVLLWHFFGKG